MISLDAAREVISQHIQPLPPEHVKLEDALGRVLREEIVAPEDQPAFDRSAMDGYAVALDDDSPRFKIIGEVKTGGAPPLKIARGQCARIFTGGQIPEGATQVLIQEEVQVENGAIIPRKRGRATHIRRRGEDAQKGQLLLQPPQQLGAGELALLASIGRTELAVAPRVRVAHFVTGNELVPPHQQPAPGQIRDSNSTLVAALVEDAGGEIVAHALLRDDLNEMVRQIRAAADFDLLLISGGASVGDYDFGGALLQELGHEIHFEKVNLRPGKPLIFATRGAQAAFILPGNPVSHFVVFYVAVKLALDRFTSAMPTWNQVLVELDPDFDYRADARETFWPARVETRNGRFIAHANPWQSSGDLTGLAGANALLRIRGAPRRGEKNECLLLH